MSFPKPETLFAARAQRIAPFLVMDVFERAKTLQREGRQIIHLEVGEPDFATPACIIEAGKAALDQGHTHYSTPLGDMELREAIVEWYKTRYQVSIKPRQVLIFSGTSPGLALLGAGLLERGDEVVISNPCYPAYRNVVRFSGATAVEVPTAEEDGFRLDPADVARRITPRTKALILNSPCNPTGILLEGDRMAALADLGPLVISDEIYHGLTYEDHEERSILEFTDNAIVIGGFSKAYAMTGWRVGYLIVPESIVRPMEIMMQTFLICTNGMAQRAAITALRDTAPDVARMRDIYNQRRKLILSGLRDLGFKIPVEPGGAFYALVNARHLNPDSLALSLHLLDTIGVGVSPGVDFGSQTEGYLRFSYASSLENIQEALTRLGGYIEGRG